MSETLAYGYLSESTQRNLSNEYQHDRVYMVFEKSLYPCALSVRRVKSILKVRLNKKKMVS